MELINSASWKLEAVASIGDLGLALGQNPLQAQNVGVPMQWT